jgi:phosphoserine phosphatase
MMPGNQPAVDGAWVAQDINWYKEAGLTREDFLRVATELDARDGASELLLMMDHRVIITFGIEQVVQDWLAQRKIRASVAGTRLTFTEQGLLTGHHPNVVTSTTKALAYDRFLKLSTLTPGETLVIGDSVVDVHMMQPGGFNVLLLPPGESEKKLRDFRENNLASMWERLTMILVSDSLSPLVDLFMHARL